MTLPCASWAARSATRSIATVSGEVSQLAENVSGGICRLVDSNCKPPVDQFVLDDGGRDHGDTEALDGHMNDSRKRGAGVQPHRRQIRAIEQRTDDLVRLGLGAEK